MINLKGVRLMDDEYIPAVIGILGMIIAYVVAIRWIFN
jgi:hypothetical protein